MGSVRLEIDEKKLGRLCASEEARQEVHNATERIKGRANALGSGHFTKLYHRDHKSPAVGNTQARYDGDVQDKPNTSVGIVYTANYSAMQDNAMNNTLLKAIGG